MLDFKLLRDNVDAYLRRRTVERQVLDAIFALQDEKKELQLKLEDLQKQKNILAKTVMQKTPETESVKTQIEVLEKKLQAVQKDFDEKASYIPNALLDDVPVGSDETQNQELRRWGTLRAFDFTPKEHFNIMPAKFFEQATKVSGARFAFLEGHIASLHRALSNFMLDTLINEFGFEEMYVPHLVKESTMFGTGQLPKFREDQFETRDGFWLIPTAEVPLTNYVRESILTPKELPMRLASYSFCFRKEAGSAGKDTRGMIRHHQFSKVEMVVICDPEESAREHERMCYAAETILQKLELPYRIMLLCSGDTGFCSMKTYDLEVWLPGQNRYREISSCSNCGDFQARRMKARFKDADGKTKLVHTLNGSGLAVGRTLIAVLENYQKADGSFDTPHALKKYL